MKDLFNKRKWFKIVEVELMDGSYIVGKILRSSNIIYGTYSYTVYINGKKGDMESFKEFETARDSIMNLVGINPLKRFII